MPRTNLQAQAPRAAGPLAFVMTAAVITGIAGAGAYYERDEYFEEQDVYYPDSTERDGSLTDDARELLRDLTD